jgi:hypothetical protein
MILYFPFVGGKETRPISSARNRKPSRRSISSSSSNQFSSTQGNRSSTQSTQPTAEGSRRSNGTANTANSSSSPGPAHLNDIINLANDSSDIESDIEGLDEDERRDKINVVNPVSIFWSNRLVPESFLKKLPFFPTAHTKALCDAAGLPENWRGRIKGYLFFDYEFRHISNNKLKLQVDPNIEDWLNDKKLLKSLAFVPTNPAMIFKTWLHNCHLECDKEYKFSGRDRVREAEEG